MNLSPWKKLGTVIPFLLYWAMAVQELEEIRQFGGSTTPLTDLASFSLACLVNGSMAQHNLLTVVTKSLLF